MQAAQRCAEVQRLEAAQTAQDTPDWVANARVPVLVGAYVGFIAAYFLGLFTIFHVARAYKKLELKVWLPCSATSGCFKTVRMRGPHPQTTITPEAQQKLQGIARMGIQYEAYSPHIIRTAAMS
jgi:hypothetical protein